MYIRVAVIPEEVCEGEERKIIISSLEASEACQGDNQQEQFFYVLDHLDRYGLIIIRISEFILFYHLI